MGAADKPTRIAHIRRCLETNGRVDCADLATHFGVSEMTIRRDLAQLEKEGAAIRVHGGAIFPVGTGSELSFSTKMRVRMEEKRRIGLAASEMVVDGDTIILDSGTTTLCLAEHVKRRRGLTVITNGLAIANELLDRHGIEVMVPGGIIRSFSHSLVGPETERALQRLNADKLFLGVEGLDPVRGLTVQDSLDAKVKEAMIQAAREIIVVADSSKVNIVKMVLVASMDVVSTVITDGRAPDEFIEALEHEGINVVIA